MTETIEVSVLCGNIYIYFVAQKKRMICLHIGAHEWQLCLFVITCRLHRVCLYRSGSIYPHKMNAIVWGLLKFRQFFSEQDFMAEDFPHHQNSGVDICDIGYILFEIYAQSYVCRSILITRSNMLLFLLRIT